MYDNEQTLQNCSFVKTVLMMMVIFGHCIAFWSGHWFTENPLIDSVALSILYGWINSFHIYAFAMISGYIFSYKRKSGGYNNYFYFLKNKMKRLLIPYLFAAVIWVIPISEYFFHWDKRFLIKKYVFCINPSQLWFLWMLFGVFAIVWPLWKIFPPERLGVEERRKRV